MGADTLVGNNVCNKDSDDLGDIKEIMLNMRTGRISYAVLSFGGFLGMGEKLFAVPWEALELDTENKRFVLDVDRTRLQGAPGFDRAVGPTWPTRPGKRASTTTTGRRPTASHHASEVCASNQRPHRLPRRVSAAMVGADKRKLETPRRTEPRSGFKESRRTVATRPTCTYVSEQTSRPGSSTY